MKEILLIDAVDASVAYSSVEMDLGDLEAYSVQVSFSDASLAGTLKLQSSNDATTWIDVDGSDQSVTVGTAHMWNVNDASYRFVRVDWVRSAGTGTLTAKAAIKERVIKRD